MRELFEPLKQLLGASNLQELDGNLGRLLIGEEEIQNQKRAGLTIAPNQPKRLLDVPASTAPCF